VRNIGKTLLLFLFLIPFAFNIGLALNACQCDTLTTEFLISNNHSLVEHYTIQKSGSASTWATVTPQTFALAPGDSKTVIAFASIPCSAAPGDYLLELKAVSEDDVVTQTKTFSVSTCHSFNISFANDTYSSCVGSKLTIPVNVTNTGKYIESINLLSSSGNLSLDAITLESGESTIINLTISPSFFGTESISVRAFNDNYDTSKTALLTGVECTFFSAHLNKNNIALCENEDQDIVLTLENLNDSTITVYLNTNSTYIGYPSTVDLGPKEIKNITLSIHSTCDMQVLTPSLALHAQGSKEKTLPLILNFRSCYQPVVVSQVKSSNVCACENLSYKFNIFNSGTKTATYALTASRGYITLNNKTISKIELGPDESTELTLNLKIDCDEQGDLPASIEAVGIGVCNRSSKDSVNLNIMSWGECEAVIIKASDTVTFNESGQLVIPVSVSNIGRRPASYNIEVSGSAAQYVLGISTGFVTLNPGEGKLIELTLKPENITKSSITITALSLDNLARDEKTITLYSEDYKSHLDLYYFAIPIAIIVVVATMFFRMRTNKKVVKKKTTRGTPKIKKPEIKGQ